MDSESVHAEIRARIERALRRELPEAVWEELVADSYVKDHLNGTLEPEDPEESWRVLKAAAAKRLRFADRVASEASGGAWEIRPTASEKTRAARETVRELPVGPRSAAMARAMSEFFAGLADRHVDVDAFRQRVLGGRLLSPDEAHRLVASCAARVFSSEWFEKWGIPFIGHRAEILDEGPRGEQFNPVDDWVKIRTDPPGVTNTVRYALSREGNQPTRCVVQAGAVRPIVTGLSIPGSDEHEYASWLWPGSVVDKLYDVSEELADTFDWPASPTDAVGRRRNEAAAWFVLTGHVPEVRALEGRWEPKQGKHLNPQWRINLTAAPWVPAEEVARAYRTLRGQLPAGRELPKTLTPLEVARFVRKQERLHDHVRPSWPELFRQWKKLNPGTQIKDYRNFRTYFIRGDATVKELNFGWPRLGERSKVSSTQQILTEQSEGWTVEIPDGVPE